jgi:hypothetical protein
LNALVICVCTLVLVLRRHLPQSICAPDSVHQVLDLVVVTLDFATMEVALVFVHLIWWRWSSIWSLGPRAVDLVAAVVLAPVNGRSFWSRLGPLLVPILPSSYGHTNAAVD